MNKGQRKRAVSSCIPCYTRKQKCSRQYPCNHCARRRRPEQCAYYPTPETQASSPPTQTESRRDSDNEGQWEGRSAPSPLSTIGTPKEKPEPSSLAEVFGYFEESTSNTMALVRKLGFHEDEVRSSSLGPETATEAQRILETIPSRPILDFLVQYFVAEVNWMDQLVYPPWFLGRYQEWWDIDRPSSVSDLEFAILFLRMCSYASQFLPSPAYTIDSVKGMALADIRKSCDGIADALGPICARYDIKGSLLRVQSLAFAGLGCLCEGRTTAFWETLSCAVRVAQRINITATSWTSGLDELDKEMRRRTFCNLYIWDSLLARRMDSAAFLPDGLGDDVLPRMHLVSDFDDASDAPDVFTERIIQAQLADFWRSHRPTKGVMYDAIAAEEVYEKFCREFLPTIPVVFALQPDTRWDQRLPMLPLQRQLCHMAIFEVLCYNFSPVILLDPSQIHDLPGYKQMLVATHKKTLAVAALKLLRGAATLHEMMGSSHTRFASIVIPTFEAATLLLSLCAEKSFPREGRDSRTNSASTDPLRVDIPGVTRAECLRGAQGALSRLQVLAEVSKLAQVGSRTLARLMTAMNSLACAGQGSDTMDLSLPVSEAWTCASMPEDSGLVSLADFLPNSAQSVVAHPDWEELVAGFDTASTMDEIGFLGAEHL